MIAIVLVALGVLGILGVQLRTLADTQTTVRRAQAIRLIEDLSERIKSNPSALAAGVLERYEVDWGAVPGVVPSCAAAPGCGPADMARADIAQWKATVAATMPLGDAAVFAVAAGGANNVRTQLAVMISWRENERRRGNETAEEIAAYKMPFTVPPVATGAGTASVACKADTICHLQYLQPTQRCLPDGGGDASNPPVACP
jgi:type IV pilus assembly protein PilV